MIKDHTDISRDGGYTNGIPLGTKNRRLCMEKLKMMTQDFTQSNLEKIATLFPNVITETIDDNGKIIKAIDLELLQQELSSEMVDGDKERYQLTWPGKKEAILLANQPILNTLRPKKEESVDWDNTENLYIEGDNLKVLKLLQESYLNKVKCIYIDPPYNTGKDFIYKDNFSQDKNEYLEESGQRDENGNRLFQNTDANGRFHSDWLNMMYPRLKLARNLLRDDGVIFISIDDNEVDNLKKICDEVFGASCFIANAIWRSKDNSNNDAKQFSFDHNYTLIYSKSTDWQPAKLSDDSKRSHFKNPDNDPKGPYFDGNPLNSPNYRENLIYDILSPQGIVIKPPKNGWRWSKDTLNKKIKSGEIKFTQDGTTIRRRTYLCDMKGLPPSSLWIDLERTGHNRQAKYELLKMIPEDIFDTPKPVKLIKYILKLANVDNDDIILDFFSGSATTAHAVMQLNAEEGGNRKYIMVQLAENCDEKSEAYKAGYKNISEIGKERIRRAAKKIQEETGKDIDYGFRVFEVDSTNMKEVYYNPNQLDQKNLAMFESNIKEDRTSEDLLIQVMLELGLELSLPMKTKKMHGKIVHFIAGNSLVACFDTDLSEELVKELATEKPLRLVFRDSSFANDASRINVEEIVKMTSPNTDVKVI